ncbi:MAG: hypothetical protein Q9191_007058, partial [Dirinaria sp. TL-2023a]
MPPSLETPGSESSGLFKLRNGIEDLRCKAADGHYFNPQSIRKLCTPELIKAAVHDYPFPAHKKDGIAQSILCNGILIFCILVHIRAEHLMVILLERDVSKKLDNRLPMDSGALSFMQREESRRFFEVQWEFLPVKLPSREYLQIDEHYILPYLENRRHADRGGSFGDIYKATFECSMQDMLEYPEPNKEGGMVTVIRKQIRFNENIEGFARERSCLEILQQLKHPNIVELLCSYTYKGEHSLIFPCEDMDLDDFFKKGRYRDFQSNPTFYLAVYGLISAVEYLHNFQSDVREDFSTMIGSHHDIRPHNILVRSNTFILADFGLAKMSEEGKSSTSMKGGGGEYMAPECIKGGKIGRAADIWSLGGVFLDIAAYIEDGPEGRIRAQDKREGGGPYVDATTTHFFSTDGNLKTGVIDSIQKLQENPEDKTLRTFLLLSRSMLGVNQETRPSAPTVRRNAAYIAIKSLFREALQDMIKWREQLGETDAGRIWEDTWKLWAWGEEVGINGVNLATKEFKEAIPHADKTEKRLQNILTELVRALGSEKLLQKRTPKINDRIRDLRTTLPDDYGKRIKARKACYGKYADYDPPKLPSMSDELLQSSDHPATGSGVRSASVSPLGSACIDPMLNSGLEELQLKDISVGEHNEMGPPKDVETTFDEPQEPTLTQGTHHTDRDSRQLQTMNSKDLEYSNHSHAELGTSVSQKSLILPSPEEQRTATPKPTRTEAGSKFESSIFSTLSGPEKSTNATSIEPGNSVSLGSRHIHNERASFRRPLSSLRLPDPVIRGGWPERGSILEGTGISAHV